MLRMEDGTSSPTQPDPDTIKMFVGQIPRTWNEAACRELFEAYGPVYQLNILRDKQTQQSKGCCFVTYYHRKDAIAAQSDLHNVRTLAGMHHPIQMKPADCENRNERKLFVGMISKKMTEEDVKQMFVSFGHIEDCTVLKDNEGRSKGCAFVTFGSRSNAQTAIKAMHHSQTLEGCSTQIVVKFADTQRDKDVKKPANPPSTSPTTTINQLLPGNNILSALQSALLQNPQLNQQQNVLSILGNAQLLQQQAAVAQLQQQRLVELALLQQANQLGAEHLLAGSQLYPSLTSIPSTTSPLPSQLYQGIDCASPKDSIVQLAAQQYEYLQPTATLSLAGLVPGLASQTAQASAAVANGVTGSGQSKGPEGCNLFIYHLPQDFTDTDLYNTFCPFGTVLSAKVFIDKQTNLSKCFGFVSYDNSHSAANAISGMNGFQIGTKRLKVQLKNSRGHPYGLATSISI